MATAQYVMLVVSDLVADFLYYDRKEDEDLPRDEIERLVKDGELSIDDIVNEFRTQIEKRLLP